MANDRLQAILRHVRRTAAPAHGESSTDAELLGRFINRHDELAFAILVRRHGGLVASACRRVLIDESDVEDAFQATFLVLLRKADSIRNRETLACWLHRVAGRVADEARAARDRRRRLEKSETSICNTKSEICDSSDPSWREVCEILHAELNRLPPHLRLPLILCYLDGKTRDDAAKQLGWSVSTLHGRLERGRLRLRARLARRGVDLSAALLATAAASRVDAVAPTLVRTVVDLAGGMTPSATVTALAAGAMRVAIGGPAMSAGGLAVAVGLFVAFTASGRGPFAPARQVAKPQAAREAQVAVAGTEIHGRVLGPDGKPFAGAKLFLCDYAGKSVAPQPATDDDGRFHFVIATNADHIPRFLLTIADNLSLDWTDLRRIETGHDINLRLPPDVPIRGKVVDLEGKPVRGAAVRIVELTTSASGRLDDFLKEWRADKEKTATGPAFGLLAERQLWSPEALRQLVTARTGPDGTFRLTGIGRDRGLMLGVRGAGIADYYVRVVTRPDFVTSPVNQDQVALHGPDLSVAVAPSKPVMGTLRDAKTKQPLAGIRVLAYTPSRPIDWWWKPIETTTDAEGHYRLDGLTKAERQIVLFDPGAGAPQMHRFDVIGDTSGFAPLVHDSEIFRGVVVSGRVTDKSTGRPVRARVVYAPLLNNEHYSTTPGYDRPQTKMDLWIDSCEMVTGDDGRYRLTALPGHGALFVQALAGAGKFTQPSVSKEDQDATAYDSRGEVFWTRGRGDIFPMPHLHAYRLIRPAADSLELTADFELDRGTSRRGRLIGPGGHELSGAEAFNLEPPSAWLKTLPGAEFTAVALSPAKPRRLLFFHGNRKLAGTVVLRGDEQEPVTVTMRPLAAITGRAVLKNGEPLVGYSVEYSTWPEVEWPGQTKDRARQPILTDKEGRFRVPDLPAAVPLSIQIVNQKTRYAIIHREKIVLEPKVTRDFGDLRGPAMDDSK